MFILRATAKLLARAKPEVEKSPPPSTGLLGDWYANLVYVERQQLILAVSAKTLLPVVLPAKELRTLPTRLPAALGAVLAALEIPAPAIALELAHMKEHRYAKTADRQVIGSMVDLARMLDAFLDPGRSLLDVSLHLAEVPMSALRMISSDRETLTLFGCPIPNPSAMRHGNPANYRPNGPPANDHPKRVLPYLSSIAHDLELKGSGGVAAERALAPKPTREDRERVAQKLLAAETAYYEALRRQRAENTDESREALAQAERVLKALEAWAAQVSREEVFH